MGLGGIVVNGAAGLEELDLVANLDFYLAFEHEDELLPVMGGEFITSGRFIVK